MARLSQIGIITMQFILTTKGELSDHIVFAHIMQTVSANLHIQLACSGDIEVNPGPSGVEKLISLPGQNQNGRSENCVNTLWLTHLNCRSLLPHIDELRLIFETNKLFSLPLPRLGCDSLSMTRKFPLLDFPCFEKIVKRVEGVDVPFTLRSPVD